MKVLRPAEHGLFLQGPRTSLQVHLYGLAFLGAHYPFLFAHIYEWWKDHKTKNPGKVKDGPLTYFLFNSIKDHLKWGWFRQFHSDIANRTAKELFSLLLDHGNVRAGILSTTEIIGIVGGKDLLVIADGHIVQYFTRSAAASFLGLDKKKATTVHNAFSNYVRTGANLDDLARQFELYHGVDALVKDHAAGKWALNANLWTLRLDHLHGHLFERIGDDLSQITGVYDSLVGYYQSFMGMLISSYIVTTGRGARERKQLIQESSGTLSRPMMLGTDDKKTFDSVMLYKGDFILTYDAFQRGGEQGVAQVAFSANDRLIKQRLQWIMNYVVRTKAEGKAGKQVKRRSGEKEEGEKKKQLDKFDPEAFLRQMEARYDDDFFVLIIQH